MTLTSCAECGAKRLKTSKQTVTREVGGVTFSADLPARACTSCDAVYLDGPLLVAFENDIARHLARHGPISPAGLAYMRVSLQMTGRELARLLSVTPEHLSRWENGKRNIDPCAWLVTGDLVLERTGESAGVRARVEALSKPPPKLVPIRLLKRPAEVRT
jgi:hypothetical protein